MIVFYRYIKLWEVNTVWSSGFTLTQMWSHHGEYSFYGEFKCARAA